MKRLFLFTFLAACGSSADDTVVDASLDQSQEATTKDATTTDVGKQDASPDVLEDVQADVSDGTVVDTIWFDSPSDSPVVDVVSDAPGDAISDASVSCSANTDCTSAEFCDKGTANCTGSGTCAVTPSICPLIYKPVCGCDKQTYSNSCYANKGRTSVAYLGVCE
jgi:hypothetical protein